jgi:hypothetical protein
MVVWYPPEYDTSGEMTGIAPRWELPAVEVALAIPVPEANRDSTSSTEYSILNLVSIVK